MADRYASWSELLKKHREGFDFMLHVELREGSPWLVAAPHGGSIEPGTTEIARAIAGEDFSFYSVEGRMSRGNAALHITSHRFDEPEFGYAASRHERVFAIHGCCDAERAGGVVSWIGGSDEALVSLAVRELSRAGYRAERDYVTPGQEPENLCNRGRSGHGLQLELPEEFRRHCFRDLTRSGRVVVRPELTRFAAAVRNPLKASL